MKKSNELKQDRAALVKQQTDVTDLAQSENREFSAEEATTFDNRHTEIKALDVAIERAEKVEEMQKRAAAAAGGGASKGQEKEFDKAAKRLSIHKAIRSFLPGGELDGVERELHEEMKAVAQRSGIEIQGLALPTELRAEGQTVTQDAGAYGANLVAEDLGDPIPFLRPEPVLVGLGAKMVTGLQGNVAFPTNDGGITAAWEGEITEATRTKNAYGKKTMAPNRLVSTTFISMQNLFQSNVDLENLTKEDIRTVVANKLDETGINGSGTGNVPEGILNNADVNVVVGGANGAAPTWAHLLEMESEIFVANANAAKMAYLFNPGTKGKLKQTAHLANASNYLMNMDNSCNGYPVGISTLVPNDLTKGTLVGTANAALFGDFSQLMIGQWGFYDLDVNKVAREAIVEITVNAFYDMLLKQAKAFSVVKDWDLS